MLGLQVFSGAALVCGTIAMLSFTQRAVAAASPQPAKDSARSAAAFTQLATVLRHPRCMNCHTVTEFPRQGNERRRHDMLVMRGADDHGAPAMRCSACHQNTNQDNGVPGAPNWGLAPLSMAWENLNDGQLADVIKDPAKNGHRSLEQIFEHMAHDELVGWAWRPGATHDGKPRELPPMSHEQFAKLVREWIDTGAVSPKS